MKKILVTLAVSATLAIGAVASPTTAEARWHHGFPVAPVIGGLAAGALIGAALAVVLRRGGLLLPVLVLPLTIPVLIFGVSASNDAVVGPVTFGAPFTILCALTLGSLVLGPFAAAAALRQGAE